MGIAVAGVGRPITPRWYRSAGLIFDSVPREVEQIRKKSTGNQSDDIGMAYSPAIDEDLTINLIWKAFI
jgi:hypothetical protein